MGIWRFVAVLLNSLLIFLYCFNRMPRAKREKIVPLTKTKKQTKEEKGNLIQRIRDALDTYERFVVILTPI
jgi:hypothetical protein